MSTQRHIHIHHNFIYISPKVEKKTNTQISINRWIDKNSVACLYSEVLVSNKKELTTDTRNTPDKSQEQAESKKPDTKENILYDSF